MIDCNFGCTSRSVANRFDAILRAETTINVSMDQLCGDHVGWYLDISDGGTRASIHELGLRNRSGVYILWRAVDFCDVHLKEVLQAVYVGKAGDSIDTRLVRHFDRKTELGGGLPVELTVWRGLNRQAKYVEQLLLDTFLFTWNDAENTGTEHLFVSIDPGEWN